MEGGAEHLRSLGQNHPATKGFSSETCSQQAVTAHRARGSASPQDGMEKGQSGRKLRTKAEQAQDSTQHQCPILANTFFVLSTPSALLAQAPPAQLTHCWGGGWCPPKCPLVHFGPNCKTNPKEETNGKSSFNSTTSRHPSPEVELSTGFAH